MPFYHLHALLCGNVDTISARQLIPGESIARVDIGAGEEMLFSVDMTTRLEALRVTVLSHDSEELEARLYPSSCPPLGPKKHRDQSSCR